MKKDIYQEVTNRIVAQLEAGTRPWQRPWNVGNRVTVTGSLGYLPLRANGAAYTSINVLLLLSTGYQGGTHWMTYNRAAVLGGQVRKGEKSTAIVFFKPLKIEDKANPGKTKTIPLLRSYNVFNVAQIDGLPERFYGLPVKPVTVEEKQAQEIARNAAVDAYVENTKAVIEHHGDRAFFTPAFDKIVLPPQERFTSTEGYYDTLLHELTHWTGHTGRLERTFGARFGDDAYAQEELVAEIGSAFLCAGLGITRPDDLRPDHADYIAAWLKVLKNDPKAVFQAAAAAQKAVDHLNGYQPNHSVNNQEEEDVAQAA